MSIKKNVFDNWIKFLDLVDYKNSYHITSKKELKIKNKRNIDLFIRDKMLKLLDAFYIPSFIINSISIIRLW